MLEKVFATSGDLLIGSEFNLPMINILWQILAGTRCALIIISSFLNYEIISQIKAGRGKPKGYEDFEGGDRLLQGRPHLLLCTRE